MNLKKMIYMGVASCTLLTSHAQAAKEIDNSKRVEQLELVVQKMLKEIQELKKQNAESQKQQVVVEQSEENEKKSGKIMLTVQEVEELKRLAASSEQGVFDTLTDQSSWLNKLTLGGYGDIHANFSNSEDGKDKFDLHRLVLYTGYQFNDWLSFTAETEIEHAFSSDDSGGEVVVEQAYADALIDEHFNIRIGRVLAPLGITNSKHEPTTFNGVERPLFDKYMIPSTWSLDGIGAFGKVSDNVTYEAYLTGSLDADGFDPVDGIRGGRMKERPDLNDPAISGRLDYFAINTTDEDNTSLRLGLSGFIGGMDNKNKGGGNGHDGTVSILSADYEFTYGDIDLRGAIAHTWISEVDGLADGVGEEQFGFYQELGIHILPDAWKTGKLCESDLIAFVRYDLVDTQKGIASGATEYGEADRQEWTFGLSFLVTPQFVLKADYQIREDESNGDPENLLNFGLGFNF